jgi:hypothetical protein
MLRIKWFAVAVVLVSAVLTVGVGAAAVTASGDNGVTNTHFTLSYTGGAGAILTCDGERIVKSGPNGFVQDSESCTTPIVTFHNGRFDLAPNPPAVWFSDYEGFVSPGGCLRPAISGTLVVTGNGHNWSVTAFYDPSFTCP